MRIDLYNNYIQSGCISLDAWPKRAPQLLFLTKINVLQSKSLPALFQTLDAAVDLKFATLKIPLSILLINCKVVFFFTQWQAMRAVGTTHVILYRVDNLSTRSPRPWQAPVLMRHCSILQELPFFDWRKIWNHACTQKIEDFIIWGQLFLNPVAPLWF